MHLAENTPDRDFQSIPELREWIEQTCDDRQAGWLDALRQDAVESIGRMSRRRQHRGIHIPVHDLFVKPMRQSTQALSRRFVHQAAVILSARSGLAEDHLVEAGSASLSVVLIDHDQADLTIRRDLFERGLAFRVRYEAAIVDQANTLYRQRIRPWFVEQLDSALAAMEQVRS